MSSDSTSAQQPDPGRRDPIAAVSRTLERADAAAWRGKYADALGWLRLLELLGYRVPAEYDTKRQAWLAGLAQQSPTGGTDDQARDG
jgi:hypothetical protein